MKTTSIVYPGAAATAWEISTPFWARYRCIAMTILQFQNEFFKVHSIYACMVTPIPLACKRDTAPAKITRFCRATASRDRRPQVPQGVADLFLKRRARRIAEIVIRHSRHRCRQITRELAIDPALRANPSG